jgi:ferredoxin
MNAIPSNFCPTPESGHPSDAAVRQSSFVITPDPSACTGCRRCLLACSDAWTKTFNPSRACIQVMFTGAECAIHFDRECTKCGICVDHCFFGALRKSKKEKE